MPSRKQRKRRAKDRRHEWEYVRRRRDRRRSRGARGRTDLAQREAPPQRAKAPASGQRARCSRRRGARSESAGSSSRSLMFLTFLSGDLTMTQRLVNTAFLLAFFLPFSYAMDVLMCRLYKKRPGAYSACARQCPARPGREQQQDPAPHGWPRGGARARRSGRASRRPPRRSPHLIRPRPGRPRRRARRSRAPGGHPAPGRASARSGPPPPRRASGGRWGSAALGHLELQEVPALHRGDPNRCEPRKTPSLHSPDGSVGRRHAPSTHPDELLRGPRRPGRPGGRDRSGFEVAEPDLKVAAILVTHCH